MPPVTPERRFRPYRNALTRQPAAQAPAAAAAPAGAAPQVLTPAQAAQALGVSEEDVMTEITAGHLKARQIGSQWRIAQSALDEFLRG